MIVPEIYDLPWHLFGPKARKHLVMVMTNAQETFYFTCGKLYNIDLKLFLLVSKVTNNKNLFC